MKPGHIFFLALFLCVVPGPGARSALGEVSANLPKPDGRIEAAEKELAKNIEKFEGRVREVPADFMSANILGQLYSRRAGEFGQIAYLDRARETYEAALKSNPQYLPAKLRLAANYAAQHRFADGLRLTDEVLAEAPEHSEALSLGIDARFNLGRYEEAEAALKKLAELFPEEAPVLARQAQFEALRGENKKALQLLSEARNRAVKSAVLPPEITWYRLKLGEAYFRAGDLKAAEKEYGIALDEAPGNLEALDHVAELLASQGKSEQAIETYKRIIERSDRAEYRQALGDLYAFLGRPEEARPWHDLARTAYLKASDDGYVYYYHHLAGFFSDCQENPAEAVKWAKKDLALRQSIGAEDALAWALYKAGDFKGALEAERSALRYGTRDPHQLYHASMIFSAAGDLKTGKEYLKSITAVNPAYARTFHVHR